jgi:hypothetical protein
MTSTLNVAKLYLSGAIVDPTQASTKAYADDLKLQADAHADTVKSDIMGGLPASTLDTLKEISDFLASDGTIAGGLASQISGVNIKISEEKSRAQIAEATTSFAVATEKQRAEGAEAGITSALAVQVAKQISDKTASDASVAVVVASVVAEASTRSSADVALTTSVASVSGELATHKTAYDAYKVASASAVVVEKTRVDSAIAEEKKAREDADAIETTTRTSAVSDLAFLLSEESASRVSAVSDLAFQLSEESGSRVSGQNALEAAKMDKAGGVFTSHVQMDALAYLYIGNHWRIAGSADGKRLHFEHSAIGKAGVSPIWVVGVPFIEE